MSGYYHILLSFMYLFNYRRWMEKILQKRLTWLRSLYTVFLCEVAQIAMLNKMIYGFDEINQIIEVFREVR